MDNREDFWSVNLRCRVLVYERHPVDAHQCSRRAKGARLMATGSGIKPAPACGLHMLPMLNLPLAFGVYEGQVPEMEVVR